MTAAGRSLGLSRRRLLSGALAVGLNPIARAAAAPGDACPVSLVKLKPKAERAVSLKGLSLVGQAGGRPRLEGLTRLDGVVTDPDTRDVILWGLSERGQPDLQFDDFVIALRAAY